MTELKRKGVSLRDGTEDSVKETHQGCLSRAIVRPQATFLQSYYGLIAKMPQLVDIVYKLIFRDYTRRKEKGIL
ncbi:MAG: hypothetical protein LUG13_05595 [Oscillospiraceae bacterium]|nr:hypothetical protein [Oscillospiraceae bacterium]